MWCVWSPVLHCLITYLPSTPGDSLFKSGRRSEEPRFSVILSTQHGFRRLFRKFCYFGLYGEYTFFLRTELSLTHCSICRAVRLLLTQWMYLRAKPWYRCLIYWLFIFASEIRAYDWVVDNIYKVHADTSWLIEIYLVTILQIHRLLDANALVYFPHFLHRPHCLLDVRPSYLRLMVIFSDVMLP